MAVVFVFVVTFVGFLIHLYSVEYMAEDAAYARFFAYMNLFVGSMLVLVLADNLLLLYLGWEGVGLCSYLLIGFWHADSANGAAARKAFIVTRIGDTAMAIALFIIFKELGTLHIQEMMTRAASQWPLGSGMALAVAALLLGGAVGKSAQLPLQTWLPDAMAGPTPVSALIHAATMVTAGVYLIARTHVIFLLAPSVMAVVAVVGALTLLIAGFSALAQNDIKRVLAYSTISQIGYMFLALGVGAWSAAVFHFMTHAFFKALLFLGAGAVILACHHEQDMFKMGGLRSRLPLTFWTFLVGAASLASLPLVTAGFYSKDLILWRTWLSGPGCMPLYIGGLVGALLTAVYTFRMVFIVFFGEPKAEIHRRPGLAIALPLVVLAFLSMAGGFVETPETLGHVTIFSKFMEEALPAFGASVAGPGAFHAAAEGHGASHGEEVALQLIAAATALIGVLLAWLIFGRAPRGADTRGLWPFGALLERFWRSGWGFDWIYDRLFVWPFAWIARVNKGDAVDAAYTGVADLCQTLHRSLSRTQSGRLRAYAAAIAAGAIIILAIVSML
jgi:NADH-quinone oxidoreductase subunit L